MKRDQKAGTIHANQIDPKKKNEDGTTTTVASDNKNVFLIVNENYLNIASDDCIWIINSRASFHVTPHEVFFSSYQKGEFGMVKMGNHVTSKTVGIREVTLIAGNGSKLVLKEVRHVLEMRLNLISTRKLDEAGWQTSSVLADESLVEEAWSLLEVRRKALCTCKERYVKGR